MKMKEIRNIIFDLGGVLYDINYQHIVDSFAKLQLESFDTLFTQLQQDRLFDQLETGHISAEVFRDRIRSISKRQLSDLEIDTAWNSILVGFPERNLELLRSLKNKYRLFLLSNTNEIHEKAFRENLLTQFGRPVLDEEFERVYLSHHIGLRKPDSAIFQLVINENNLAADHTLFIDDSPQHVEGAKESGLHALWLRNGKWIGEALKEVLS